VLGVRRAEVREIAGLAFEGEIYNVSTITDDKITRIETTCAATARWRPRG
jgi:hypothetical protein